MVAGGGAPVVAGGVTVGGVVVGFVVVAGGAVVGGGAVAVPVGGVVGTITVVVGAVVPAFLRQSAKPETTLHSMFPTQFFPYTMFFSHQIAREVPTHFPP